MRRALLILLLALAASSVHAAPPIDEYRVSAYLTVQDAINAAKASGKGGIVRFPCGTVALTQPIVLRPDSGARLRVLGPDGRPLWIRLRANGHEVETNPLGEIALPALPATLEVQVIRLIRELQCDIGCSVLFISHHLGAVAELCGRVAIMYAGEVVEQGTAQDIFRDARHPYTRKLLECDPGRIAERQEILPTIPGELPDLRHIPQGCIFRDRCPDRFALCSERPPVETVRPGHQAACHKARELVS